VNLHLDWCSYRAAKYAVEHWHYSRCLPAAKLIKIGVWENQSFKGVVIFSCGNNMNSHKPFNIGKFEVCELSRIALARHSFEVSRIISVAIKLLKHKCPKLKLIISYADPFHGHNGTIYQASNWFYIGSGTTDTKARAYKDKHGKIKPWRSISSLLHSRGERSTIDAAISLGFMPFDHIVKHKYLYPLDNEMRKQIEPLRKLYPKKLASVVEKHNTTPSSVEVAVQT